MKWNLTIKTNARHQNIEKIDKSTLKVSVKSSPQDGKANKEVINLLAKYFSTPKSDIKIVLGTKNRKKIVEINS